MKELKLDNEKMKVFHNVMKYHYMYDWLHFVSESFYWTRAFFIKWKPPEDRTPDYLPKIVAVKWPKKYTDQEILEIAQKRWCYIIDKYILSKESYEKIERVMDRETDGKLKVYTSRQWEIIARSLFDFFSKWYAFSRYLEDHSEYHDLYYN